MATLDAFLIRGKKKAPSSSSLQDTHNQHAFVNPFTVQMKKPSVVVANKAPTTTTIDEKSARRHQPKRNTIAHYFTPAAAAAAAAARDTTDGVDVEMQDVCVIRNKIPVMNLWDMIQYELDQDPFYNDTMLEPSVSMTTNTLAIATAAASHNNNNNNNNCIKRRRLSRQGDDVVAAAAEQHSKRQRKTDHELSSIMTRFLNMGSVIKHHHPPNSLDLMMNEFSSAQEDTEDLSRHVRYKQTPQESHLFLYHMAQEFLDFAIND